MSSLYKRIIYVSKSNLKGTEEIYLGEDGEKANEAMSLEEGWFNYHEIVRNKRGKVCLNFCNKYLKGINSNIETRQAGLVLIDDTVLSLLNDLKADHIKSTTQFLIFPASLQ